MKLLEGYLFQYGVDNKGATWFSCFWWVAIGCCICLHSPDLPARWSRHSPESHRAPGSPSWGSNLHCHHLPLWLSFLLIFWLTDFLLTYFWCTFFSLNFIFHQSKTWVLFHKSNNHIILKLKSSISRPQVCFSPLTLWEETLSNHWVVDSASYLPISKWYAWIANYWCFHWRWFYERWPLSHHSPCQFHPSLLSSVVSC